MSNAKQSQQKVNDSRKNMNRKLVAGRNGVHIHLQNVLIHAVAHNDLEGNAANVITDLDDHGQSQWSEAVMLWLETYAGFKFNDSGQQESWEGAAFVKANFADAKKNPFWTLIKKKNSFKGMDFVADVQRVISNANKMMAKDLSEEDQAKVVIDLAKFRAVKEAIAA